jgi:archaetidylinositol phosphate synthase
MMTIGTQFSRINPSPNFWSGIGLVASIIAAVVYGSAFIFDYAYSYHFSVIGGLFLLLSGFFDLVDGCVARQAKEASKRGAFLDSIFDKVSESIVFVGIAIGTLASPLSCIVALTSSLLVSYVRARSESLGISLQGIGIGERAERLLLLAVIGMLPIQGAMQWAVIIVSIVAGFTLAQRTWKVSKRL